MSRGGVDGNSLTAVLPIPMRYHAAQFRAARAATKLGTREVASGAAMSMRTLFEIEQPDKLKVPKDNEAAEMRLVEFYESQGITFLPNAAQGVGIRVKVT